MDMSALAGAQTGLKAAYDMARLATGAVVDNKVKQQMIDMQAAVLDVQAKLADAHAERLALLDELSELKIKLRAAQDTAAQLDSYELCAVEEGKFLFRFKATEPDVPHYACPVCYANRKVSVLQAPKTGTQQHLYTCKVCNSFNMYVGPSDPKPPRKVISSGFVRNW